MKLTVQCYTVRDQMAADLWGTLTALANMGLKYVEVGGTYGLPASEFKAGLDKLGLTVSANHVGINELENNLETVIADNKAMGNKVIVLPWIGEDVYGSGWANAARRMEGIAAKLKEAGLVFCYHNHAFEFKPEGGKPGLDVLYEAADPSLVKAQIDTYWVAYGGGDPASYIKKLKGRVPQVHFKDGKIGGSEPYYVEVGSGDLKWDGIIEACKEAGVEFVSIELDVCPHEPLESVRMSVEFIRGKGITE